MSSLKFVNVPRMFSEEKNLTKFPYGCKLYALAVSQELYECSIMHEYYCHEIL